MSRSLRLYFEDILNSCHKVLRYTKGMNYEQFFEDELRFDAVLRNLQIIGEAIKQVPTETRNLYPAVEWRKNSRFKGCFSSCLFQLRK